MNKKVNLILNQLAEVLIKRGFIVNLKSDHIHFSTGNAKKEIDFLEDMFSEVKINVKIENQQIYLIDSNVSSEKLNKILWYPARNHEAGGGDLWRTWKYFIKRTHGPKINTFSLETGVARLTKAISAAGITTICSCDGHGRRPPQIHFCGWHNGIWFEILFDNIKSDLDLHYEWYVEHSSNCDIPLTARRIDNGWDLEYILEDTNLIADYFIKEATHLSNLKKELFSNKYKSTRKLIKEMNIDELHQWMLDKFNNYYLEEGTY
jgi:hypothetical protein